MDSEVGRAHRDLGRTPRERPPAPHDGHEQRWARDISIITADEAYFRAFCIVRSVFQCVLESSGTVT